MPFFIRAHKGRERDTVPARGKVAQDVVRFDFGTRVGRVGDDLGEEENVHLSHFAHRTTAGTKIPRNSSLSQCQWTSQA